MKNKIKLELEITIPGDGIIATLKRLNRIKSDLAESGWKVRTPGMKIGSEAEKP